MTRSVSLATLLIVNALPLYGVFFLEWSSFLLIYLYWLENVIIGIFNVMRMVVRPYRHPIDFIMPVFVAPFFVMHYGAFTAGHGTFVISLFGDSYSTSGITDSAALFLPLFDSQFLLVAAAAVFIKQWLDWVIHSYRVGLGSENIKDLMAKPYRRILVLHVTIIGSGFALDALDEPTVGLIMLVLIKTASDIYFWKKDAEEDVDEGEIVLDDEELARIREKFPEPKVDVNGKPVYYDSFEEMEDSSHYRMLQSILRLAGQGRELKAIQAYMDLRIAEEKAARQEG